MTVPEDVFSCCCDWGFEWIQQPVPVEDIFAFDGQHTDGYDISDDAWAVKDDKTFLLFREAGAAVLGLAYSFGGSSVTNVISAVTEEFNRLADLWTTKTSMSVARHYVRAMTVNDLAYVAGGEAAGTSLTDNEEYDSSGNSWATRTSMPSPGRQEHALVGLISSNLGYAICGHEVTPPSTDNFLQDNDEYDQGGNSWSAKTSAPAPARIAPAACLIDSKIYMVGGNPGGSSMSDNDEYDPGGDSWASKTNSSVGRNAGGMSSSGLIGYLNHGLSSIGVGLTSNEAYDQPGDSWSMKAPNTGRTKAQGGNVSL